MTKIIFKSKQLKDKMNVENVENLRVIHLNCFKMVYSRSVSLKSLIIEQKPDIAMLNELKLNDEETNNLLQINGFNLIRKKP